MRGLPDAVWCLVSTPDGPFGLIAAPDAVLASGWSTDLEALSTDIHPSIRPTEIAQLSGCASADPDIWPILYTATAAVADYYAGDCDAPVRVPVRQVGTEFQQLAWSRIREIEAGTVISYADLASRIGQPGAVRAAAAACARCSCGLFVPAQRVIYSDGTLGGFGGREDLKASLLRHEGVDLDGRTS